MSYYWFNKQGLLKKAKEKYHNNGGKKKLPNITLIIKIFSKKKQKMCTETRKTKRK